MSTDPASDGSPPRLALRLVRVPAVLALVVSTLHLLVLVALTLLPDGLDRRLLATAALVLLAFCAAAAERLRNGHPGTALVLAGVPTAACLLFDAYVAFADGPGHG